MASRQDEQQRMTPESVEVRHDEQVLEIRWADGHRSIYPLFGLRKNCPCVMCRGGHSKMGTYEMKLFFVDPPQRMEVRSVETVGNHALKIEWGDGHSTGMYRWELLRAMCPVLYQESNDG
ncbi:MAG: DUF971 domain-containing protein [Balneolaceae bacterium]